MLNERWSCVGSGAVSRREKVLAEARLGAEDGGVRVVEAEADRRKVVVVIEEVEEPRTEVGGVAADIILSLNAFFM